MRPIVVLLALMALGFLFVPVTGTSNDAALSGQLVADVGAGQVPVTTAEVPDVAQGTAMLARQPVAFIENQGQWEGEFSYLAKFGPMAVFLEDRGWAFTLTECKGKVRDPGDPLAERRVPESAPGRGVAVRMRFGNGADAATPIPEQRLSGVHNYFLGNDPERWKSNVPLHGSVRMAGLYDGIDVRARSADGHFEYDLLVEPGAELAEVEVEVEGADGLHIDADGTLVMETKLGPVRQPVPKTWQVTASGERQEVACRYVVLDDTRFGFAAPGWDRDHALVVDPGLIWSTFLGGSGNDFAFALALDSSGAVTVAGHTDSSDFPTTPGTFGTTHNGTYDWDAFVTRLDPPGGRLLWSTFLGGGVSDWASALALDSSGAVTVAGQTVSSGFPTTPGTYDPTYNGGTYDAFVTRIDATGSNLLWSTFLGGGGTDWADALALDPSGAVAVAGRTGSSGFPTTPGAYDTTYNGGTYDAFVTRLDPTGSNLLWSTFLGGGNDDYAFALALDSSGAVTVAGWTYSSNFFPTTPGAYDTTHNGTYDAFVTRLDPTGGSLLWSTFLGGGATDWAYALALDPSGAVTVAGFTGSSGFPTTPGAYDPTYNSNYDAFVTRLDATGSTLLWSTFLGGGNDDYAYALALDSSGAVTVAGHTDSSDFPTTPGAYDPTYNSGSNDAFVTRLDPTGFNLGISQAVNLAVTVGLSGGQPLAPYYIFYSNDPLNGTAPGLGWAAGLHISVADVLGQLSAGAGGDPLFGGTLDASGAFFLTIPGGGLSSLSGQTWWGMGLQVNPCPTGVYDVTPIQSITFQ